jgi:hypothetical protein
MILAAGFGDLSGRPAVDVLRFGVLVVRRIVLAFFGAAALCVAQQATVDADELAVRANSSPKSNVVGSLKRGDRVTLGLVLSGGNETLCEVTFAGPPGLFGYVPCGKLQREAAPAEPNYTVASPSASQTRRGGARAGTDASIAEALRLSGIGQTIDQLANPALYMSSIPRKNLTPEQLAEVRQIVMQSMRPERFRQAVTASLKSSYPEDDYPQLLDMMRSPLARQMTAIEVQSARVDGKAIQAFATGLQAKPPDAQHLAIIRRIDQATGGSQLMVDIVAAVLEGIASASQISAGETRKMLEEVRGQQGDVLRQAALIRMLYQYRTVPDDQLNEYSAMLSSPVAVRFSQAAATGMLDATRQASAEMMVAIMQRFPVKPPPRP